MDTGKKITGGKYHANRKRRLYQKEGPSREVIIGETKRKQLNVRGGHPKIILLKSNNANISVGKSIKKAEIINVEETPQNKFFARQNRLMKGAIIMTSIGRARITNRPSQEGNVNAIFIEEKK